MSFLAPSLDAANQAISKLHGQLVSTDPTSDQYREILKNVTSLLSRKDLLAAYSKELDDKIDNINAVIVQKIEQFIAEMERERAQLIANVKHEIEDKVIELPALDFVELNEKQIQPKSEFPNNDETVEMVTRYMKKYADDFKTISSKVNFFHAAACSGWGKYVAPRNEGKICVTADRLLSQASLPSDTKYPLSLAAIDRIIHLPSYKTRCFVILDASLRVILTNASDSEMSNYVLIHNSNSNQFAPVSDKNFKGNGICRKCFRYPESKNHSCQRRCPICLRTGNNIKCSKPTPESPAHFCFACQTYCQTSECFVAHKKICPRPVSGLHDDILQFLKCLNF